MNGMSNRLDELDRKIVDRLSRDARVSNRGIAAELGVTEGTIRTRIKRLQSEGLIQFTVVTDFRMAGSPNLCMIGIDADPARVSALAQELSAMPQIGCVIVLLGRYSLMAMTLMTSIEGLSELVSERIRPLEGVRRVETSISIHNLKYEAGMAKITTSSVA
jgi:DNA-binding Lrp family transcriptional regulator